MTEDEDLENRITAALMVWQTATGPVRMRQAYEKFRALVAQRSPAQVLKLEQDRGIDSKEGK